MLVERNENQKVELKERERMAGREQRHRENSKRVREIGQRRQIRIPEHTRKIRVGGNKHKQLWLEFIQLSPANSILKVGSFTKFFALEKKWVRESFFGIEGTRGIFLLK